LKENPWHKEGHSNKEWVLLDYISVVVHIFNKDRREFFGLEKKLWGDAKTTFVFHAAGNHQQATERRLPRLDGSADECRGQSSGAHGHRRPELVDLAAGGREGTVRLWGNFTDTTRSRDTRTC